ncbi:MAG TPA: gamma-glutamylcyclotransferase family protein [Gammaproteobacteria bacterium]|nr:gamma-glutamylcyclotransferase family protein [Gammaproteobacteria bacterium]
MISARSTARDSLLFVYGTLRAFVATDAGERLRRQSRLVGYARVAGRLYDLGRYPGLCHPRRAGEWVIGEVYRLRTPRLTLRALDRYESGARPVAARFVRERALAQVASGSRRRVWVYRFVGPVYAERRIVGGDYERHRARNRRGKEPETAGIRAAADELRHGARTEGRRL